MIEILNNLNGEDDKIKILNVQFVEMIEILNNWNGEDDKIKILNVLWLWLLMIGGVSTQNVAQNNNPSHNSRPLINLKLKWI